MDINKQRLNNLLEKSYEIPDIIIDICVGNDCTNVSILIEKERLYTEGWDYCWECNDKCELIYCPQCVTKYLIYSESYGYFCKKCYENTEYPI